MSGEMINECIHGKERQKRTGHIPPAHRASPCPPDSSANTRLSSLEFHSFEFGLYALQDFGVRFWFNLPRGEPVTFIVRTFDTRRIFQGRDGEDMSALGALVMADLDAWRISWVPVWILVFLGRVAGTISATGVLTAFACLGAGEESLTLAAYSSDALPWLPVDEILAASLGRPLEDDLLGRRVPVGNDGSVLGTLLENSGPLLAALLPLGLGALRRHPGTLLAALVLALGTLLAKPERGVADMALPVHTHADGLLYPESVALRRMPLAGLDLQAVQLADLLRTRLKDLGPWDDGGFYS